MKIALVEDTPLLRETFGRLLAQLPGHSLVAAFPSAEDALAALQPGAADLLVADLDLPGQTGIELIARVRDQPLALQAVVWTVYDGADSVYAALRAGAVGYLLKSMGVEDLRRALLEIEQGGAPMSPRIARRLLRDLIPVDDDPSVRPPAEDPKRLSVRERHVLRAVAAGHSHKEIASEMGISAATVHTHLKRIYRKLHAVGRDDALQRARDLGIVVGG